MFGKIRAISDQQGFSMAEVVMAMILFSASVLGISGMVMTGAADVARGATDSLAANLAAKRIEEVRSLPFYRAWEGTPQDIDDFYFNTDPDLTGDKNHQQLDHPKVVENYGSIAGSTQYKRTTAIQYQEVSDIEMSPAVMAANWVPSNPRAREIDRPKNDDGKSLHAMIIEVCVYYRIHTGNTENEIVYRQHALEGDMIIPGGAGVPPLTVTSIAPSYGSMSDYNALVKITISSEDNIDGGTFDVRLWKAGSSDIIGTGTTVAASEIDTYFDLTQPEVEAGLYNISVYWQERGWLEKNFRNCFTAIQPVPGISSVDNFNWGTSRQSSRLVTIHGSSLAGPTTVSLVGPAGETVPGQVVSWNKNTIMTKFNLTSVPASSKGTRWDVRVVTAGGTYVSDADNKRVLMNPKPVVTSITGGDTTGSGTKFYRKKKYTNVTINGKYFGGVQGGASPTVTLKKSGQTVIDPNVAVGSVTETSDPETGVTSMKLTLNVLNLGLSSSPGGGPFTSGNSETENGAWKVVVTNEDTQESTDDVYATVANAPIEISEGWSDQQCWGWDLPLSVKGKYFDPSNTTVSFLDSDDNPCDPESVFTLTGVGTPTGSYDGSAQAISGGVLNLINVPPATYKIRVKDTENNQYADKELVATYQKPGVPYYIYHTDINPTVVTEGTNAKLDVRAKGMYDNCSFTVKFWGMDQHGNDWVHDVDNDNIQKSNSSPQVTWSRSDKYVQVTSTVDVPVDGTHNGIYYKTATYGAQPEIMVTNPIGDSEYWTGGHPTVN